VEIKPNGKQAKYDMDICKSNKPKKLINAFLCHSA